MLRVLLVQTQDQSAQFLSRFFEERGDIVASVLDLGKAATFVSEFKPDLMVLDLHFLGNEWITFLRLVRIEFPDLKIIITNKYPDLEREMRAREQGVRVFVRYPYTQFWLNRGLRTLNLPVGPGRLSTAKRVIEMPKLNVPVRVKLTIPYLILLFLLALVSAFIVSQVIIKSAQQRFTNQLTDTRLQASDWMVRKEDSLLKSLRLIANSEGVGDGIETANSDSLRNIILPVVINANEEVVQVLDMKGVNVFSAQRPANTRAGNYNYWRGDQSIGQTDFVKSILAGETDNQGDKFAGLVATPTGNYFYVAGPVFNSTDRQVGVLLVGNSLKELSDSMRSELMSQVTFYATDGQPLESTLFTGKDAFPVGRQQVSQVLSSRDAGSPMRTLTIDGSNYGELLGPWEVRGGEKMGVLGVSLPQTFLSGSGMMLRWELFILVTVGIFLVVGVGLYLAGIITTPLRRLASASSQISQGNLDVKVDVNGNDEVAALAQSFNQMVTGLQEGEIYREILGRDASPDVREELRLAFANGILKLEGQELVGTALYSDIRDFSALTEQAEPTRVFDWLNEYFNQLVPIVKRYRGVVNQFNGDSMLAFFGILPTVLTPQESALAACRVALEMIRIADDLNARRSRRGDPPLITGIGVNTGVMFAGGLGAGDRLHYSIIGDTVNMTQTLESITREIYPGNGVLISHATFTALGAHTSDFRVESLGRRIVRGKTERILVYRLLPFQTETEVRVPL
jgi:adenylate cyclase